MAQDDELARVQVADTSSSAGGAPSGPSVLSWTPEMDMQASAVDRLSEIVSAVIGSAGGKPPKVKPMPRPDTATHRLQREVQRLKHRRLTSRVLKNS